MFILEKDDKFRIERAICVNGHFYLRFCKREKYEEQFTLGFGYDEPFKTSKSAIKLIHFVKAYSEMALTTLTPVNGKWVKYINDYPRNPPLLPNKYHICTNWIKLKEESINRINSITYDDKALDIFKNSFSVVASEDRGTENCRTIILRLIKDSLDIKALNMLNVYYYGNPLWNDIRYGCVLFDVNEDQIYVENTHPCGNSTQYCCKSAIQNNCCTRKLITFS